jgi:hypothetical protein
VAGFKKAYTQRNFALGETRADFLEAKQLEIRGVSMRRGENVRIAATGVPEARPGSWFERELTTGYDVIELRPETGVIYGLIVNNGSIDIINSDGLLTQSFTGLPWTDASQVWVEPFREVTVIGYEGGIYQLFWDGAAFIWAAYAFDFAAGNSVAQPYWAYIQDATITPSARTGTNITITASRGIWDALYVGQRIRYGQREILITTYVSPTVLRGDVISTLPPSYKVTVENTVGMSVGDAVIAGDTDFSGFITQIIGNDVYLVSLSKFDGPDIDEKLSAASASSKITAKVEVLPLPSPIWDEPLMSPLRGYPRSGASASGRLALADFPQVPDLVALSSVRAITDFKVGAADDDAIVRQCGDNSPRFLHVVNAGDILLMSDRGLYYLSIRDGDILTPNTFNPILFDKRGCSSVKPVPMDDGVIFVEASGQTIAACVLDGNIYLKWSVRTISTYHSHLIKSPTKLCGPSLFAETPEKYLFVVNGDGTLAAMSWFSDFSLDSIGFVPWSTQGSYRSMSPIFGGYWSIVDRSIGGVTKRFLERMDNDALLDCSVPLSEIEVLEANGANLTVNGGTLEVSVPASTPLAGETVHVAGGGYYGGTRVVAVDGVIPDVSEMPDGSVGGFNFVSRVMVWPHEWIETERAGLVKARTVQGSVSVMSTGMFQVRANSTTKSFGGYWFGDDLSEPPPDRTKRFGFTVTGNRDYPEVEVIKPLPARFKVLAITQEVTA